MKISTEIDSISKKVGEEKAVELVAKAGFDAWDFSMFNMARWNGGIKCIEPSTLTHPLRVGDHIAFSKKLRQIGEDNGIHCNQSHAPFPVYSPEIRSYLKRAIEIYSPEENNDVSINDLHKSVCSIYELQQKYDFAKEYTKIYNSIKEYGVIKFNTLEEDIKKFLN